MILLVFSQYQYAPVFDFSWKPQFRYLLFCLLTFVLNLSRWNYQVAEVFGQFTIRVPVGIP